MPSSFSGEEPGLLIFPLPFHEMLDDRKRRRFVIGLSEAAVCSSWAITWPIYTMAPTRVVSLENGELVSTTIS